MGDLVQELGVVGDAPADVARQAPGFLRDEGTPLLRIGHDAVLDQEREILGCQGHLERRRPGGARAVADAVASDAGDRKGDDGVAEQSDEPADGPGEGEAGLVPAHAHPEVEVADEVGQQVGEDDDGWLPLLAADGDDVLASIHLLGLQVGHLHALAAGKALGSLGGLPAGVEGDAGRRALDELLDAALAGGQILHDDGEAAGRAEHAEGVVLEAGLGQPVRDRLTQLGEGSIEIARRQLLGPNLENEGGGCIREGERRDRTGGFLRRFLIWGFFVL